MLDKNDQNIDKFLQQSFGDYEMQPPENHDAEFLNLLRRENRIKQLQNQRNKLIVSLIFLLILSSAIFTAVYFQYGNSLKQNAELHSKISKDEIARSSNNAKKNQKAPNSADIIDNIDPFAYRIGDGKGLILYPLQPYKIRRVKNVAKILNVNNGVKTLKTDSIANNNSIATFNLESTFNSLLSPNLQYFINQHFDFPSIENAIQIEAKIENQNTVKLTGKKRFNYSAQIGLGLLGMQSINAIAKNNYWNFDGLNNLVAGAKSKGFGNQMGADFQFKYGKLVLQTGITLGQFKEVTEYRQNMNFTPVYLINGTSGKEELVGMLSRTDGGVVLPQTVSRRMNLAIPILLNFEHSVNKKFIIQAGLGLQYNLIQKTENNIFNFETNSTVSKSNLFPSFKTQFVAQEVTPTARLAIYAPMKKNLQLGLETNFQKRWDNTRLEQFADIKRNYVQFYFNPVLKFNF